MSRLRPRAVLCALLLGMLAPWVSAGSFNVVPVRLYFGARDRAVAVTLSNTGNAPIALQADLYTWSQDAQGEDRLTLTEDLILAPPLIRIAPGSQQVVRLALLRPIDPDRQLTYRLIVRELAELEPSRQDAVMVPVTLALNIPVFVTPPLAQRTVTCVTERVADKVQVQCENSGNAHALLREIVLKRGSTELARFAGGAYVLPGVRRRVPLEAIGPITPGPAQLYLSFDDDQQVLADEQVP